MSSSETTSDSTTTTKDNHHHHAANSNNDNDRHHSHPQSNAVDYSYNNTAPPSMTMALFVYWILPVLLLAMFSRFSVELFDPVEEFTKTDDNTIVWDRHAAAAAAAATTRRKPLTTTSKQKDRKRSSSSSSPSSTAKYSPSYQELVDHINKRRRPKKEKKKSGAATPKDTATTTTTTSQQPPTAYHSRERDPNRLRMNQKIEQRRNDYQSDPNNVYKALHLADALREKDVMFHDGGSSQAEALDMYQRAEELTLSKRQALIEKSQPTHRSLSGTTNIQEEIMMEYSQRSVDGLLCQIYTNMGKQYFMANMFERAVEKYSQCLNTIEPLYLEALGARGSSLIILGRYEEAGRDLMKVIENDHHRLFNDAFTGLAKVLVAKEEVVPEGWGPMVNMLEKDLIPKLEERIQQNAQGEHGRKLMADTLNRFHHVLFTYHDNKTKDTEAAWKHLTKGYEYKMSALPPFQAQFEQQKLANVKQIFQKGFWPPGIGSPTESLIFIVGFVRSGSTLLERVLDAHPLIVGTGEDSVFNGRLDHIRNSIVQVSMSGDSEKLPGTVRELADDVVEGMRQRWEIIDANTEKEDSEEQHPDPLRFADKMLTNYYNIGFIHMLFPNALILHVAREPMDTIFSAFKHEFPPGTLDYTSEFSGLAQLYHGYRDMMEHWDKVLPGRVTHVRYEDMVNDMPGMAKAIIRATGLPWDESVLDFHKKKHAVNTLSTTQVRKGVYKHSLQAWKRYEEPLQPLVKLIGDRVNWDLKTTLPQYVPPEQQT
jgi:tetratricopeptide (TPR) repeat protein